MLCIYVWSHIAKANKKKSCIGMDLLFKFQKDCKKELQKQSNKNCKKKSINRELQDYFKRSFLSF